MKKIGVILLAIISPLLFAPSSHAADPNFDISINSNYDVKEDGNTTLSQIISIKNKTEYIYTPSYSITIGFDDVENVKAFNNDGAIPTSIDNSDPENKKIKLTFPKRYTGNGTTNTFTLQLDTKNVAKQQGNIWEVSLPGISNADDFVSYQTKVTVPESFGPAKIIKPQKNAGDARNITFSKDDVGKAGVYLLFGEKQYYFFNVTYHIENPNLFPVRTEIALPPDTNYQNVHINSISLPPGNVVTDEDGNWLAEYRLLPAQKQDIVVSGIVELLANPEKSPESEESLKKYIQKDKYWDSLDPEIKEAAKSLKTPEEIYDFVVETLSYNFDKVSNGNERLGGVNALKNPSNAVCLEFTDLFVSLARANGIPSRGVEGYAYTDNDKLRPLSLLDDVLHAWPEYYDKESQRWIMVDPTWGNTTKGMDYFNTLDFEHIAFVIKGVDSEYPIPAGGYKFEKKTKDVEVKFATKEDFVSKKGFQVSDTFSNFSFPGIELKGAFIVKNIGNSSVSNIPVVIRGNELPEKQFTIDYIPPFGEKKVDVSYDAASLLTNTTYNLTMLVGGTQYEKSIKVSFIPDVKMLLILGGIICGSIIVAIITYRTGSVFIQRRRRQSALRRQGKRS